MTAEMHAFRTLLKAALIIVFILTFYIISELNKTPVYAKNYEYIQKAFKMDTNQSV